jgi:hypothetical protein
MGEPNLTGALLKWESTPLGVAGRYDIQLMSIGAVCISLSSCWLITRQQSRGSACLISASAQSRGCLVAPVCFHSDQAFGTQQAAGGCGSASCCVLSRTDDCALPAIQTAVQRAWQELMATWRLRITTGPFDPRASSMYGKDTNTQGALRGAPGININLFLKLGDAFGNPIGKAPAGAFVQESARASRGVRKTRLAAQRSVKLILCRQYACTLLMHW